MNTIFSRKVVALSLLLLYILLSFSSCEQVDDYNVNTTQLSHFLSQGSEAIAQLDQTATAFQKQEVSIDTLKSHLTIARKKYKKVEFYITYYNPDFANAHLNGAPLLKIIKSGIEPSVIPPEGLQVLDELIFSENPKEARVQIAALAKKLKANYSLIATALKEHTPSLNNLVNAARLQLVRVFTLGVTGFDTPGSVNGLEESRISLLAMKQLVASDPNAMRISGLKKSVVLVDLAADALAKSTFDTFDRLDFLINYIDPLYKTLGELPINKQSNLLMHHTSWNPESSSIFAADFLDPYYFTQLSKEDDSPALRKLGETLFYDTILSNDNSMSCATCHKPEMAFTDGETTSLASIEGTRVLRNSPTLMNAVFAERFFYDVRAFNLEQQVEHVIFNPKEFNTRYSDLLQRLNEKESYKTAFSKIYTSEDISREHFASALASYVLSLQSHNSEFDKYVRGEIVQLDPKIIDGFNLFSGKAACATCHFAPTFSGLVPPLFKDSETEILGVLKDPKAQEPEIDDDEGRWENNIANERAFIYEKSFKTSTVRNAALTAPYFHNGAYNSLEEVLDFYNKGGGAGLGLKVTNQTLPDANLQLSTSEIEAIIAFLNALTETDLVQ